MAVDVCQVTVIVPAFNRSRYLGRCLRSLIRQNVSRESYKIIVVDDGSTDETSAVLSAFGNWIKVLRKTTNEGLPSALNWAIRETSTPYVIRVDSDDFVNENLIAMMNFFLEDHKNVDAVRCDYLLVDDSENVIRRCDARTEPIGCGIMFKTGCLQEIGLYDEEFLVLEEVELMNRFEKRFTVQHLPLALYRYRQHLNNMTKDTSRVAEFASKLQITT